MRVLPLPFLLRTSKQLSRFTSLSRPHSPAAGPEWLLLTLEKTNLFLGSPRTLEAWLSCIPVLSAARLLPLHDLFSLMAMLSLPVGQTY